MAYLIDDNCNGCGACPKFCPVGAIAGEKGKKHTVEEGLCIECGVCGRVCPHGAVMDSFGIVCLPSKPSLWRKPVCFVDKCTSCGICISACPTGAVHFSNEEGNIDKRRIPILEGKKCISCGFCASECPFEAKWMADMDNESVSRNGQLLPTANKREYGG